MDTPESLAKKLIDGMGEIPSLPQIYYQIKKEVNDPYSSISRIAEVISVDQSLSGRILRLANSAFFGFPRSIETITDAVSLIGLQQVRDIALCTMVMEMFKEIDSELVDMNSFWRHSLGCGICARVLATYHREPNIERFFVAGLIHDLGRLILLTVKPGEMINVFDEAREQKSLFYKVEREHFTFDHADVGAELLMTWQLPEAIIEAAKYHHRPTLASRFPIEAGVVHFADILTHAMELGGSGERYVPPLSEETWKKLNFKTGIMAEVMREVDRQYIEVVKIMLNLPGK